MNIKKRKTILDYFKSSLGSTLDQTQTENKKKRIAPNVIRQHYFNIMVNNINRTDKYGITFTFARKWHDEDTIELHRLITKKIGSSRLFKKCSYKIYPEFNSKGVLHYHGFIYGCYQIHVDKINKWWKRTYGYITKIEYSIRYPYCGNINKCVQNKTSNAKHCWLHYITKDSKITGLWTISS